MKTNPLISLLNRLRQAICPGAIQCSGAQASSPAFKEVRSPGRAIASRGAQPNSTASPAGRGQGRGQQAGTPAHPDNKTPIKFAKYLIPAAILLLFLIAVLLTSCKSPATLTNDTRHHTRDSNYHATVHRIETHDTIIIGPYPKTLPAPPLKGGNPKSPFKGDLEGLWGPFEVAEEQMNTKCYCNK